MSVFLLLTSSSPYCEALNKNSGKPKKDDLTCKKEHNAKGLWGFDVAKFAYKYDDKDYKKVGKNI